MAATRVLVVDDDLDRTILIRRALKKRLKGHEPELWMAQSAQEAVEILGKVREWDVVFLDHDLLGSFGFWKEDLGEQGNDGRTVARAMIRLGVKARNVVIQSVNKGGGPEIRRILDPFYKVILAPFPGALDCVAGKPRAEWRGFLGRLTTEEYKALGIERSDLADPYGVAARLAARKEVLNDQHIKSTEEDVGNGFQETGHRPLAGRALFPYGARDRKDGAQGRLPLGRGEPALGGHSVRKAHGEGGPRNLR